MSEAARLDKWLWHARFFKSRSLASRACSGRGLRLNRNVVAKAHHLVRVGDVLTFVKGGAPSRRANRRARHAPRPGERGPDPLCRPDAAR